MADIFDGKAFAEETKKQLSIKVAKFKEKGIEPTLASIYLADDEGSVLYTKLKKKLQNQLG